jgi:hypothetical protein
MGKSAFGLGWVVLGQIMLSATKFISDKIPAQVGSPDLSEVFGHPYVEGTTNQEFTNFVT